MIGASSGVWGYSAPMETEPADRLGSRPLLRRLLLFDAEAKARRLGDARRRELHMQMAVARQKGESANVLWASEQYVEALRLAREALVETGGAVRLAKAALEQVNNGHPTPSEPDADWPPMLGHLGAPAHEVEAARAAVLGPPTPAPVINRHVTQGHRSYFQVATLATQSALRRIEGVAQTPSTFVVLRWLLLGSAAVVLVGLAILLVRLNDRPPIEASAELRDEFSAARIVDGNRDTEWLLPDQAPGWIGVNFAPRPLKAIRILNGHNRTYNDRAVNDFRIEVYLGRKRVHTSKHSFGPGVNPKPDWVRLPVQVAKADSIVVLVDSWHKNGGSLAELAWE
jgi:hypothetical protein